MQNFYKIVLNSRKYLISAVVTLSGMIIVTSTGQALAISNQAIIVGTNSQRSASGLAPLAWNSALSNSAALKARDMCANGYWAHTAPDGATGWTFMSQAGYRYKTAGENLAKDFLSDAGVVAGWMASPGHRANIVNPNYLDIGVVAVSCSFQGAETTIVVAHYGATQAAPKQATTPKPAPVASQPKPQTAVQPKAPVVAAATIPSPEVPVSNPVALPTQPITKPELGFGAKLWKLISTPHTTVLLMFTGRLV